MRLTIGADPELFLATEGGFIRSAIGYVGGTKLRPKKLSRAGYFVQEDNVAAEFNIPPAQNAEAFVESIQWTITEIAQSVKKYGFKPHIVASEIFPECELSSREARMFGCEPDYNAWTKDQNPRPEAANPNLRSCGGHIHAAVNVDVPIHQMVQAKDLFLGVPSVMMDSDTARRDLYGKAGAHRPTRYDVTSWEYRVLSNFWIRTPELTKWAYTQTERAIRFALQYTPEKWEEFMKTNQLGALIQKCINTSDVNLSQRLIAAHNLEVV